MTRTRSRAGHDRPAGTAGRDRRPAEPGAAVGPSAGTARRGARAGARAGTSEHVPIKKKGSRKR